MHTEGSISIYIADQVFVNLLRQERQNRGYKLGQGYQCFVERGVGSELVHIVFALPEAPPTTPDIPVRQVIQKHLDRSGGSHRVIAIQVASRFAYQHVQFGQQPPVQHRTIPNSQHLLLRIKVIEHRIGYKEAIGVPERQQLAFGLIGRTETEIDIVIRVVAGEHPAHHIGPHVLGRVIEPNGIPLAFVHLLAVFVTDQPMRQHSPERRTPLQRSAHRQQGIEPVAELERERLGDELCGKPLFPVRPVVPVSYAGIRYNTCVQPGIAYIRHTRHRRGTSRAADLDCIHPGTVRCVSLESFPAFH